VPKFPESLTSLLQDRVTPTLSKVKKVNPAVAKESASKGAAGAKDVVKLSIDYLKQETKGPLQGVGRLLAAGIAGGLLMGTGLVLLGLAFLRGLQSAFAKETVTVSDGKPVVDGGTFSGTWSFVPYVFAAIACLVLLGIVATFVAKSMKEKGSATP
jgi:hypothetical protein